MAESMTRALNQAKARTVWSEGTEWQQATITDITPVDTPGSARSTQAQLTATTQDGTALTWQLPAAALIDHSSLFARLRGRISDDSLADVLNGRLDDGLCVGETIWVREDPISAAYDGEPPSLPEKYEVDKGVLWDTSGNWRLESPFSRRDRQTVLHRWGRFLMIGVILLDETLGLWWRVLELGLIAALAVLIEPAWVIVIAGLLLVACQEVGLLAVE
jgi:hypothetical protein